MSNYVPMAPYAPPPGPMHPYPGPPGPHHHAHGFCRSCCHPISQCMCHRDCRKIEKELLVQPTKAVEVPGGNTGADFGHGSQTMAREEVDHRIKAMMDMSSPMKAAATEEEKAAEARLTVSNIQRLQRLVASKAVPIGMESTVIGGGCCVHLSVEYMPLTPLIDMPGFSAAMVLDSQSTLMLWGKYFVDDGYHIKECIISTNPGSYLWVASVSSVTRVRWCEIVSC
ncbi:MAG: hypothetical protein PVJ39_14475 [Gammaproteobacteria bacterium]